jgi:hypothetical protein
VPTTIIGGWGWCLVSARSRRSRMSAELSLWVGKRTLRRQAKIDATHPGHQPAFHIAVAKVGL